MQKTLTKSVACVQAKPSVRSVTEDLLAVATSCGVKDQLFEKVRIDDRTLCYRACLSHYRNYMLSELKDDEECSFHPEEAKQIHSFAESALNMLLANPALDPGDMIDMMPKTKTEHFFEKDFVFDLFLFLSHLNTILFQTAQEA